MLRKVSAKNNTHFSNTYLIGNSSKLLKSFKINKTSSNNLKGFEKVLRKKLNKR